MQSVQSRFMGYGQTIRPLFSELCCKPVANEDQLREVIKRFIRYEPCGAFFRDNFPYLRALIRYLDGPGRQSLSEMVRYRLFHSAMAKLLAAQVLRHFRGSEICELMKGLYGQSTVSSTDLAPVLNKDTFKQVIDDVYLSECSKSMVAAGQPLTEKRILFLDKVTTLKAEFFRALPDTEFYAPVSHEYSVLLRQGQFHNLRLLNAVIANRGGVKLRQNANGKYRVCSPGEKEQILSVTVPDLLKDVVPQGIVVGVEMLSVMGSRETLFLLKKKGISLMCAFIRDERYPEYLAYQYQDLESVTQFLKGLQMAVRFRAEFFQAVKGLWLLKIGL